MNVWRKMIYSIGSAFGMGPLVISTGAGVSGGDVLRRAGQVSATAALAVSTVYACVTLYSDLVASLPVEVHEGSEANASRAIDNHWLLPLLNLAPNDEQVAFDFWNFIGFSMELWQNAYVEKRSIAGRVVALLPLDPAGVRAQRLPNGSLRYRGTSDGRSVDLAPSDVIHVRGAGGMPLGGLELLSVAREAILFARDAQEASSALMANGLRPGGVLSVTEALKPEQRAMLERGMVEKFLGAMNAGRPMVLDNGAKFEPLSFDPEKAQMLQTRGFSVEEICRFFGVPPFLVGHSEKQTSWGTGVEQQTLGFYKYRLAPRLRRIEQAFTRALMTSEDRSRRRWVRFSMDDLLRGDMAARAAYYKVLRETGCIRPNEVRGWEGMAPDPEGNSLQPPGYARMAGTRAPAAE